MRGTISNRLLRSLKPTDKPFQVHDASLPGFLLRVQPSGVMTYYCDYRVPGNYDKQGRLLTHRKKLGRVGTLTPDEAREEARRTLADVVRGEDPQRERKERERESGLPSLREYLDGEYREWRETEFPRTATKELKRLKHNFKEYLDKRLVDLNPVDLKRWQMRAKQKGRTGSSINRSLYSLRAVLTHARESGMLEDNALAGIKPYKVDNKHARYLEPDEEARLFNALETRERRLRDGRTSHNEWLRARKRPALPLRDGAYADHLRPLVTLLLHTGLRRGEAFSLTWDCVDLKRRFLLVKGERAKSKKTRDVPLNPAAHKVLHDWKEQQRPKSGQALVFPNDEGKQFDNVGSSWAQVLAGAKIDEFRLHDLRHTFASRLAMAGVDLNTIRELLGHNDIQMVLRYAHLSPNHKADAVAKLVNDQGATA